MPLSTAARLRAQARRLGFAAAARAGAPTTPAAPAPRAPAPPSAAWEAAMARSMSQAAMGAAHDAARKDRRPGGQAMPRPRWAADEAPARGGWEPLV